MRELESKFQIDFSFSKFHTNFLYNILQNNFKRRKFSKISKSFTGNSTENFTEKCDANFSIGLPDNSSGNYHGKITGRFQITSQENLPKLLQKIFLRAFKKHFTGKSVEDFHRNIFWRI